MCKYDFHILYKHQRYDQKMKEKNVNSKQKVQKVYGVTPSFVFHSFGLVPSCKYRS